MVVWLVGWLIFKNGLHEEDFSINTRGKYRIYISRILYICIPNHIEDVRAFQTKVDFFPTNFIFTEI